MLFDLAIHRFLLNTGWMPLYCVVKGFGKITVPASILDMLKVLESEQHLSLSHKYRKQQIINFVLTEIQTAIFFFFFFFFKVCLFFSVTLDYRIDFYIRGSNYNIFAIKTF